eukprot:gnl/Trimastix_PCT/1058.p1 GENE.gnl/Trimastix_PCT/1058~~gnl/Trimastix_PCT/1058.p1  ORF type:complete len:1404 (-),score=522.83 gnl/Trimastix_PCT/1058:348-4559(-)
MGCGSSVAKNPVIEPQPQPVVPPPKPVSQPPQSDVSQTPSAVPSVEQSLPLHNTGPPPESDPARSQTQHPPEPEPPLTVQPDRASADTLRPEPIAVLEQPPPQSKPAPVPVSPPITTSPTQEPPVSESPYPEDGPISPDSEYDEGDEDPSMMQSPTSELMSPEPEESPAPTPAPPTPTPEAPTPDAPVIPGDLRGPPSRLARATPDSSAATPTPGPGTPTGIDEARRLIEEPFDLDASRRQQQRMLQQEAEEREALRAQQETARRLREQMDLQARQEEHERQLASDRAADRAAREATVAAGRAAEQEAAEAEKAAREQEAAERAVAEAAREAAKRMEEELERKLRREAALRERREATERAEMESADHCSEEAERVWEDHRRELAKQEALRLRELEEQRIRQLEEAAVAQDRADAENADLVSVKVLFPNDKFLECYRFHLPRAKCTVGDLKDQIEADYGYLPQHQRLFFKAHELTEDVELTSLPKWGTSGATSSLRLVPAAAPVPPKERCFRPLQQEPTLAELRDRAFLDDESAATAPGLRDWLAEQLEIEAMPHDTLQASVAREKALLDLLRAFGDAATQGVELILTGHVRPLDTTLLCTDTYGTDGERFIVSGILFRRAASWDLLGEDIGEGDVAFKVAGHELKGLALARARIDGVCVPLAVIVDHFGIRFMCHAIAPVDTHSLAYGSNTGCLVVRDDPDAHEYASRVAERFNVKAHGVTEHLTGATKTLALPCTAELHRAPLVHTAQSDPQLTRFFLLSLGRVLPPDLPGPQADAPDAPQGPDVIDSLTRLLRHELVSGYGEGARTQQGYHRYIMRNPIQCDHCGRLLEEYEYFSYEKRHFDLCLSCYATACRQYEEDGREILRYPIPRFTKKRVPQQERLVYWKHETTGDIQAEEPIETTPLNPDAYASRNEADMAQLAACHGHLQGEVIGRFIDELERLECAPLTGTELAEEMHKRGINMRYLGRIATVRWIHLRQLAVREMLARTIKVLIRDGLYFSSDKREYNEENAKYIVLHYLNEIFTPQQTESSQTMWQYIEEFTLKKFDYAIEEGVRDKIYLLALLHSVTEKLGLTMARYAPYDFNETAPFQMEDLVALQPTVKLGLEHSDLVDEALQQARDEDAKGRRSLWHLPGGPERAQATTLLREAIQLAEYVYGARHVLTADAYFELAQQLESRHCERGRPEHSRWNKCGGIPHDELSIEAEQYYRRALEIREEHYGTYHVDCATCYLALARLCKPGVGLDARDAEMEAAATDDPAVLQGAMEAQAQHARRAVDIVETVLGVQHPDVAAMAAQLAMLYQEQGRPHEASPWIRKAFVVLYSIFGTEGEAGRATQDVFKTLQAIETSVDSGLEQVPIDLLPQRIEQLEFDEEDEEDEVLGDDLLLPAGDGVRGMLGPGGL